MQNQYYSTIKLLRLKKINGTHAYKFLGFAQEKAKQNNNNKQNQLANDTAHLRQQEQNQLLQPREIFLSFDVASS